MATRACVIIVLCAWACFSIVPRACFSIVLWACVSIVLWAIGRRANDELRPERSLLAQAFRRQRCSACFFSRFDLVDPEDISNKPQLLYLNIELVVKRGFPAFWWWLYSEILLHFEIQLEKFQRPFRSLKTPYSGAQHESSQSLLWAYETLFSCVWAAHHNASLLFVRQWFWVLNFCAFRR